MIVLGLEGTAWNLSASLVSDDEVLCEANSPYIPIVGGIHPREAAQHFANNVIGVISEVLSSTDLHSIEGVAFSQGPGLGPCLRIVGTAASASAFVPSKEVPYSWRDFGHRNRELFGQVRAISRINASGRPQGGKTRARVTKIHTYAVRRQGNGLFVFGDRYRGPRGFKVRLT